MKRGDHGRRCTAGRIDHGMGRAANPQKAHQSAMGVTGPGGSPPRWQPHPSLPQPLILLPPPLGLMPRSLIIRRHPLRDIAPRQRQQRHSQPLAELNPEGGSLRQKEHPASELRERSERNNYITNSMTYEFDSLFCMVRQILTIPEQS